MDRGLRRHRLGAPWRAMQWAGVLSLAIAAPAALAADDIVLPPDERPIQFDEPQAEPALIETTRFIRADVARENFAVSGEGLAVAVLDTGLRTTHVDFAGRVPAQRNFTGDDGGDAAKVTDGSGHGTNVAGIVAAGGNHTGIAPKAAVIPLKVLRNDGGGSFAAIRDALQWVIDHREQYGISVVNMSLGDSQNLASDAGFAGDEVRKRIATLRAAKVPVVVAAGNAYYQHKAQGMGYPAIARETTSVGAVYDAPIPGGMKYRSGAEAYTTKAGQITPFSQRLHVSKCKACATDVFAPGAPVTSSGSNTDVGESVQHGTSQAAPVTAGVVLLVQEFYRDRTGALPSVDQIESWLQTGGVPIEDRDEKADNVPHTGLTFVRLDAVSAIEAAQRAIAVERLRAGGAIE